MAQQGKHLLGVIHWQAQGIEERVWNEIKQLNSMFCFLKQKLRLFFLQTHT